MVIPVRESSRGFHAERCDDASREHCRDSEEGEPVEQAHAREPVTTVIKMAINQN